MARHFSLTGLSVILLAVPAFAAPDGAPVSAPVSVPAAASAGKSIKLQDIVVTGISAVGENAAVTIEMPAEGAAGTEKTRGRRVIRKGAQIPGSGYVVKDVTVDSVTFERDGKVETLKLSNGGAVAEPAAAKPAEGDAHADRRAAFRRMMSPVAAVTDYQTMSAEDRKKAKTRLEAMKMFMEAGKKMMEAQGEGVNDQHQQMMARGEQAFGAVEKSFGLIEQIEAANASGDTAKAAELTQNLEEQKKALATIEEERNAQMDKWRTEHAQAGTNAAAAPSGKTGPRGGK